MSKQTDSQILNSVTVSSWNVGGLNSPVKHTNILCHLEKLKSEILALLQETHLIQSEACKLKQKWVGQVFHSGFNSKNRGVVIVVHKKTPFGPWSSVVDSEGRYIIDGLLYNEPIVIINLYGPNINYVPFSSGFNIIM